MGLLSSNGITGTSSSLEESANTGPLIVAAGILFRVPDGRVLLVKRSDEGDWPCVWATPGGKVEEGETLERAAVRECVEELDYYTGHPGRILTRRVKDNVDYTTFIKDIESEFVPRLNNEHTSYVWISPADALQFNMALHPGVVVALKRDSMNEQDLAFAMAEGDLTSPQPYANMVLWKMRFTGTGYSLRPDQKEFVLRPKEIWHTDNQLARIIGVPVIWEHPPHSTLDSKEHAARVIGSVVHSYINGDDIDCIARVYDEEANKLLMEDKLSTSPTVVFGKVSDNKQINLDDGSHLVIEGNPSYIDHLAVCDVGVWDKGEPPSGVRADSIKLEGKGYVMTDMVEDNRSDAEKEMDTRMDAFKKECADMIAKGVADAFTAMKRADAEKMEADKKRADAEKAEKEKADAEKAEADRLAHRSDAEKEKADAEKAEKEKADAAAKADSIRSENEDLKRRLRELETRIPKQLSDDDFNAMAATQAKADSIYMNLGKRAPRPMDGETHLSYRKRLATGLKNYSPDWKEMDLSGLEGVMFDKLETKIYADALDHSLNPIDLGEGEIREIRKHDPASNRTVTEFRGTKTFIHQMGRPKRVVSRLGLPRGN